MSSIILRKLKNYINSLAQNGKHTNRMKFRIVGASLMLGTIMTINLISNGNISSPYFKVKTSEDDIEGFEGLHLFHRKLAECEKASGGELFFWILVVLYTFIALAIVCDEYFVPALEAITDRLQISNDVAGATLMAAGGSAPELFTSLIGTFKQSDVGFGTIVGSAVFNVLFVIGCCAIASSELLVLTWWPLFRDCTYYTFGLLLLAFFFVGTTPQEIVLWEALVLFLSYFGYVWVMKNNEKFYDMMKARLNKSTAITPNSGSKRRESRTLALAAPMSFRAGLVNTLIHNKDIFMTASVSIVTHILGDVHETFKRLDGDNSGYIDHDEMKQLFTTLNIPITEEEFERVMNKLDDDNDGRISYDEFAKWYLRSSERLERQAREAFLKVDKQSEGTGIIPRSDVRAVILELGFDMSETEYNDLLENNNIKKMGEKVTFEEFEAWYETTVLFKEQRAQGEEAEQLAEGLDLSFPSEFKSRIWYILVFPIVATLYVVVPDVRKPGKDHLCYVSFILSICYIGLYSYVMVTGAEIIGNTLGIPAVVMGLTFLAAGTSVPDLLTSVIVAKQGNGDMAVSSSIGSNIFDILFGLPVPWLAYNIVKGESVMVGADGLGISICILIGMLVVLVSIIKCQKWVMSKTLGFCFFFFYFIFVIQDLARVKEWAVC